MNQLEILLIEDNPAYVKLLDFAFQEFFDLPYQFRHLLDGEAAISYLHSLSREALYSTPSLPNFVLLDLNLPGKKGTDVLAEIRSTQFFKDLPVFILTSPADKQDMEKCLHIGPQKFLVNPFEFDGFEQQANAFKNFGNT